MAKPLRITSNYCYLKFEDETQVIVQMWKLMGIPFTFDELPKLIQDNPEIVLDAQTTTSYTMEDLYRFSDYLIAEECHPILFDMTEYIENYEELPY